MGDSGSMLIGLLLAASTISLTGQVNPADAYQSYPALFPLVLPIVVLAVPFVDLLLAVVRRTRAGRAPWAPDKEHLHHRLLEIGHSQARAVLIMYMWSALLGFGVVALSIAPGRTMVLVVTGVLAVLALVVVALPRLRSSGRRRAGAGSAGGAVGDLSSGEGAVGDPSSADGAVNGAAVEGSVNQLGAVSDSGPRVSPGPGADAGSGPDPQAGSENSGVEPRL